MEFSRVCDNNWSFYFYEVIFLMCSINYLGIKYTERFWKTQNRPTHRSAKAKFAKKKFVIDLNLLDNVTTSITNKLPETNKKNI